ncbi:MAG TPA: ester cyclase [Terriglobales bacterium]|nr:ester cyclase [Terriglobales bacterium]
MASAENIQIMHRWFEEVWNQGRTETIYELLAAHAVARGQEGAEAELHGPQEFETFVTKIRSAFPNIKVNIEDIFGVDDKVVIRWSATMTHAGQGLGVPATGKPVRSRGISIARIESGKIMEGWDNWDQLGMWQQVGAFEVPDTATLAKTA